MEKMLYQILLFLLFILAAVDLLLVIMVTVYGADFPQLVPFQWIIGLSFMTVTGFLLMAIKKYKTQFVSKKNK